MYKHKQLKHLHHGGSAAKPGNAPAGAMVWCRTRPIAHSKSNDNSLNGFGMMITARIFSVV